MKIKKLSFLFLLSISQISLRVPLQAHEQDFLEEINRFNVKTIIEKHLGENPELLNSSKGKDIVVVLGTTGSGKSTLINYLNEKDLCVENGSIVLKNPLDPTSMKIGVGKNSETFLPKFLKSNDLLFYDLPGFNDTRGTAVSLVNGCFIKHIIENAKTVRLIFVTGQDELTAARGALFKQLSGIAVNLIPNEFVEDFSSLVITKKTVGNDKKELISYLRSQTDSGILDSWIEKGRLSYMSFPLSKEINQNDKLDILDVIKNTSPKKINTVDISVIYNNQEKSKIKNIYTEEIENIYNLLVNSKININTISSLSIENLEKNRDYFTNIFFNDLETSLNKSEIITLLRPFSEEIYLSGWKEAKENLQYRIQNISEQIKVEKEKQGRIIAENARKAEEQRRIAAENDRKAEEKKRIAAENDKKAEQQKTIEIEKEAKLNNPANWPSKTEEKYETSTYWGQKFTGDWEAYRGGRGISRRTKHRKPYFEREISVVVTKKRNIAQKPNTNHFVTLQDWQQVSETEKPTGNVRPTGEYAY